MSQHAQFPSDLAAPHATDVQANQHNHSLRGSLLLCSIIMLLPVIYVLSLGPAIYGLPSSVLRPVYGPLIMFEQQCPPLDRFQTWYMEKIWKCKMW